jgi:hypothetical protein
VSLRPSELSTTLRALSHYGLQATKGSQPPSYVSTWVLDHLGLSATSHIQLCQTHIRPPPSCPKWAVTSLKLECVASDNADCATSGKRVEIIRAYMAEKTLVNHLCPDNKGETRIQQIVDDSGGFACIKLDLMWLCCLYSQI